MDYESWLKKKNLLNMFFQGISPIFVDIKSISLAVTKSVLHHCLSFTAFSAEYSRVCVHLYTEGPNQITNTGRCETCSSPGEVPTADRLGCYLCPPNSIVIASGCVECPEGAVPDAERQLCIPCPPQ